MAQEAKWQGSGCANTEVQTFPNIAGYFPLLGQARFIDAYLFDNMSAVQNMIAPPPPPPPHILLKFDTIGRALLYWLHGVLHL